MARKVVAIWLSLVMVFGFVIIIDNVTDFIPNVRGTILYVNETGSDGAYTSIQDAINFSSDGDTVFVFSGTYREHVIVNRTINLIGEKQNSTIINGTGSGDAVAITADSANMIGFTVTGSGSDVGNSGIRLDNVQDSVVANCTATENGEMGIYLSQTNDVTLVNTTAANNSHVGISLLYASNTLIAHNTFSDNDDRGIYLFRSHYNQILHNIVFNNSNTGIYLYQSTNNTVRENIVNKNSVDGIQLYISSNGNSVINNKVYNNNRNGIAIQESSNDNGIFENMVYANDDGLYMAYAFNNTISNNTFSNNGWIGIEIRGSHSNLINGNNVNGNQHIGIIVGMYFSSYSHHNMISQNNLYGNDWVGIHLYESHNITVIYNNVVYNDEGIRIVVTGFNNVSCNNINNNNYGFYFQSTSYNNITSNNIVNNDYGLQIWSSEENRIYNNNIIDSKVKQVLSSDTSSYNNIWNDSDGRGNYWSDYTGSDDGSNGRTANDGIGDTLIPHPFINQGSGYYQLDNYPLMRNHSNLKQGWNLISLPRIQENRSLIKVPKSFKGLYDAVQWYNSTDIKDPWKHYKVAKPYGNDLFELNETMGFWIHITQPGDTIFLYNGTQPTQNQTIPLHPGWNMVGYPSMTSYNRTEGLNNLTFGDQVDSIWSYDAVTQKWEEMGESGYFQISKGYYIHAKSESEWEVPL